MTDKTSKYLLGIACIFAGAFMPLILGTLTLLPPGSISWMQPSSSTSPT